jgi:hypothetical protein
MKLKCPQCRYILRQIGNEIVREGDRVACGMCGYIGIYSNQEFTELPPTATAQLPGLTPAQSANLLHVKS